MATRGIYDLIDEWNGADDFDFIKGVVTNTLSGSGSNLLNLSVAGGASIVGSKGGVLTLSDGSDSLAISPVAATTRTNLGLGTMATQAASAVAITGGSISGLSGLSSGSLTVTGVGLLSGTTDGLWTIYNSAGNGFGRLCFGGQTNGHPSLKRNLGALQVRLADDSAFTDLYGNYAIFAGGFFTSASSGIGLSAGGSGIARLTNVAETDFSRLCLGLATSSFPALKRSSSALHIRLADDSGYAPLAAGSAVFNGSLDCATFSSSVGGQGVIVTPGANPVIRGSSANGLQLGSTAGTSTDNILNIHQQNASVIDWGNDTKLQRDAANTLALRNSTNAQAFNIYNTWTSSSVHERLSSYWSSNVARIETQKGGSGGTACDLSIGTDSTVRMTIAAAGGISVASGNSVGIGVTSDAAAALHVQSTTQGVLLPRMNTTQRGAISSPPAGLIVYDTDNNSLYVFNGSDWGELIATI